MATENKPANIKKLLRSRGETTVSLAHKLGRPWGTVICNINGHRANRQVQEDIAAFLDLPLESLFDKIKDNGGADAETAAAHG